MKQNTIKENESICSECGKKINDKIETKWNKDAEPFCKRCFDKSTQNTQEKTFEQLNEEITNTIKKEGLSPAYDFQMYKLREQTAKDIFYKNNVWKINSDYIHHNNSFLSLARCEETKRIKDFIAEVENNVKENSTKERKLEEVRFIVDDSRQFNPDKKYYYSYMELNKDVNAGKVDIANDLRKADKLIFSLSGNSSEWQLREKLNKFADFVYILRHGKLAEEIKHEDTKEYNASFESQLAKQGIKIKLFKEHFYYYVDKGKDTELINYQIDWFMSMLDRVKKDGW